MINKPKVSVIMTVYNKSKHLNQSILSILNQSYKNLELIIVEDCSTDNSKEILSSYTNNNKVKIIYNNKNIGCYASRNVALNNSTGDLIAFQDADDYSLRKRIKKQVKYMIKYNLLMCGCNIVRSDLDKIDNHNEKELLYEINKNKCKHHFGYATLIMHKSLFDKYGCFLERRKGMDMEFGERILFKECGILFDNSDSWNYFNTKNNNIYMKINELLYLCPKMNINNITIAIKDDSFLKNKLWRKTYNALRATK